MHLSVTCPRYESTYQLAAQMRGKRMRCPNVVCRAVFEVPGDGDPEPEPPPPVVTIPAEPVKRRRIPRPIEP